MPLAHAIRKNTLALATAQNTYKENVIAVNTLVNSVLTSNLPVLNQTPPDWNDFVTAYVAARSDALGWVNGVLAQLIDVPGEVRAYNTIISLLLGDATAQATALLQNPNNNIALTALNNDLTGLSAQLSVVQIFVSGTLNSIRNFKDTLPDMAAQLNTIATKSAQDANADQAQIDQLKQQITQLQNDISSLTAAIVGLSIADGVALTLGTVVTIAAWPIGALTWLFLGPAVAVASTFIALDAIQLQADKDEINTLTGEITGLTADVATLQLLAQNYSAMAAQTELIEDNLQAILDAWQILQNDVNAAITDIQAAQRDTGSKQFTAVMTDIADATSAWNDAYNQAGALALDIQINTAELQVGMSSEQVQAAMAQGQSMGAIQYYNQVAGLQARAA